MENKILLPELINSFAEKAGLSKKQSEKFLKGFFSVISNAVSERENVKIKDFGTFKVNRVEARKSVNVSTGKEVEIPAHYKLVFVPSKELAEKINHDFSWLDRVEISDNLSNEELNKLDSQSYDLNESESEIEDEQEIPGKSARDIEPEPKETPEEKEASEEPIIATVAKRHSTVVSDRTTEEKSEELGEELEKEFGEIEPVEPFGPIEPGEAPVDTPEPSNSLFQEIKEDDDQIKAGIPEGNKNYVTREELEEYTKSQLIDLPTKEDLSMTKKNLRTLKRDVAEVVDGNKSKFRNNLIISIVITLILLCAGFFIMYFLLKGEIETARQPSEEQIEQNDTVTEPTDALVSGLNMEQENDSEGSEPEEEMPQKDDLKNNEQQNQAEEQTQKAQAAQVDTKPSDQKVYDTVTTTRYLTTISKEHYGNFHFWPYIYKENEAKLQHPDRIKPGTKVEVPNLSKYGVDPKNPADVAKAKKLGVEIYKKYNK